jgi:hypothetical protein
VEKSGKDSRGGYEDRRQQQAALIQQLMMAAVQEARSRRKDEDKVDGERTDTKGPCECGYRHWCDGREVDFVYPIETSKGVKVLGYSLTGTLLLLIYWIYFKTGFLFISRSHCFLLTDFSSPLLSERSFDIF